MKHDDDMSDDALARINLHTWRVPPAAASDRTAIVSRALFPATPTKRPRMRWLFAAFALANLVFAAIVVIIISRPEPERTVTVYRPLGGAVDAQTAELLRRLEQEQREAERKLAEVQQLRTVVQQLSDKVQACERAAKREQPVPKQVRQSPDPVEPAEPADQAEFVGACDEVSCVLTNYAGACCVKYKTHSNVPPPKNPLPEMLDRQNITTAIAAVKPRISACGAQVPVKGKVKVAVVVDGAGRVTSVTVATAPDPALGACVAHGMQQARFAPTQRGGSFSYPFVF